MAQENTEVIRIVKELLVALEKKDIHVLEAWLFGSYAQGTPSQYSDIDVALIADVFTGVRYLDLKKMGRTIRNVDCRLEVHPFSLQDKENSFFFQEIVHTGIKVA